MEKRVIPFSPPDISELEINEVADALRSGWITTGPRVKELERRLADFCHTSKVICLNSATAAEKLNLRVCGIGEGDGTEDMSTNPVDSWKECKTIGNIQ